MQFAEIPFISNIWPVIKSEGGFPQGSTKNQGKYSMSDLEITRTYEETKQRIRARFASEDHFHDSSVLYEVKMQEILRGECKENFSEQKHGFIEEDDSSDALSQESTPDGSCTVLMTLETARDKAPVVDLQIVSASEAVVEDADLEDFNEPLDDREGEVVPDSLNGSALVHFAGVCEDEAALVHFAGVCEDEASQACCNLSHEELMRNIDEALINNELAIAECQFEIRRSCCA
ncbi:hypothetical protein GUITHDRAFT_141814 [Guillardia theta CCMP2712]|uniref:Uncharacterized protein n=1 Tax=Guillardia theta (strain CCMP2712) TaxID=905079 RepID=L1IZ75_GUITC|nr:hypothetical protein GUITHDRAFT_141814 [Guillardia theta CCMP2712]EKX41546.1 hypothetical protein GUITHDRAFT_141814 [Guillardia theta CCMP2712]|eukprot:XP_005828526.1 hypothetical protein GUITHDRAFT_141814 [Guillardia theta CCMP2712]